MSGEDVLFGQQDRSPNNTSQFPNIARPNVRAKKFHGRQGDLDGCFLELRRSFKRESTSQRFDIFPTISQGWNLYRELSESVIQIHSESATLFEDPEVARLPLS
jgi:hypothetical protein